MRHLLVNFICLCVIILLWCSCHHTESNPAEHGAIANSTQAGNRVIKPSEAILPGHIDSIEIGSLLKKKMPLWLSYCKKMMPAFDIHAFSKSASVLFKPELESKVDSGAVDPDLLKYFYIPSPDSKVMLDIYSYRMILFADKAGVLHIGGGDPESTIETTDTQTHIWRRITMAGSQDGYDDACWVSNTVFLVVGLSSVSDSLVAPFFQLYDLEKERVLTGTWPAAAMPHPENYLQKWKGRKWAVKWD